MVLVVSTAGWLSFRCRLTFGLDHAQLSSPEQLQSLVSEQIGGRLWKGWRRVYERHALSASK